MKIAVFAVLVVTLFVTIGMLAEHAGTLKRYDSTAQTKMSGYFISYQ